MPSFADELRNAPEQEAQRRKMKSEEETSRFMNGLKNTANNAVNDFKKACMEAAKEGKRSIDFIPDSRCCGVYYLCDGSFLTCMRYYYKFALELANKYIIPAMEEELSTLGLTSYSVQTKLLSHPAVRGSHWVLGFRVKATW